MIKDKIAEMEKGCGKPTLNYTYKGDVVVCGYVFPDESVSYCKECKMGIKIYKEAISDFKVLIKKMNFDNVGCHYCSHNLKIKKEILEELEEK